MAHGDILHLIRILSSAVIRRPAIDPETNTLEAATQKEVEDGGEYVKFDVL